MVEQAAGCSNQNVHTFVDQFVLFLERHPTDQQCFGQFDVLGVGVKIFGNLCCQFPRRTQHQRAWHARTRTASRQKRDHRHHEGCGFAGAGLGDAQYITACQRSGNGTGLNRGGGFVSGLFNSFEDLGVQV